EIDVSAGLVPDAAVIAGHHAKAVRAGTKIVIKDLPAITSVLPIVIATFQHVTKENLFRSDEAESGVVDLQIAYQRWQAHTSIRFRFVSFTIRDELLDLHRRWEVIERKMFG